MIKLKINKVWLVAITIMGIFLLSTPAFAANQVTADGTVIADEEHLKILNSLRGTDVSYGELMEKVFPEAAKTIPKNILADMYKQPFSWSNSKNEVALSNQPLETNSGDVSSLPLILYSAGSSLGVGNPISFVSDTTITSPAGYCVPHISAVSLLYKEGEVDCIASATKSVDNSSMAVATGQKANPTKGMYRTQGVHYIVFPPGYVNPYVSFGTTSSWRSY